MKATVISYHTLCARRCAAVGVAIIETHVFARLPSDSGRAQARNLPPRRGALMRYPSKWRATGPRTCLRQRQRPPRTCLRGVVHRWRSKWRATGPRSCLRRKRPVCHRADSAVDSRGARADAARLRVQVQWRSQRALKATVISYHTLCARRSAAAPPFFEFKFWHFESKHRPFKF